MRKEASLWSRPWRSKSGVDSTKPGRSMAPMTDPQHAADRRERAFALIDRTNAEDPRSEIWNGQPHPKEWLYGRRMSAWLERLYPNASDALQLAVRAQHIRRWESPRDHYPMDRAGYLRWRTDLYKFHADTARRLLAEVGYEDAFTARVAELIQKKQLKKDAEAQALEDVACLVFLENHFAEFAPSQDEEKILGILRKTWAKMSEIGRSATLALPMPPSAAELVRKALS